MFQNLIHEMIEIYHYTLNAQRSNMYLSVENIVW